MKFWFIALIFPAMLSSGAETYTTNYVTAAPWFREVGGKLYNTQQSKLWEDRTGRVYAVTDDGIIIESLGKGYWFLANYKSEKLPVDGSWINARAMQSGRYQWGSSTYNAWDCGKPHIVAVISTNSITSRPIARP